MTRLTNIFLASRMSVFLVIIAGSIGAADAKEQSRKCRESAMRFQQFGGKFAATFNPNLSEEEGDLLGAIVNGINQVFPDSNVGSDDIPYYMACVEAFAEGFKKVRLFRSL